MIDLEVIKSKIKNYSAKKLDDNKSAKGAVIIPIYNKDKELFMLFTKRTEALSLHKGQISFPGGKQEEKDKTLFDCALRETFEEIGLDSNKIELYGEIDQIKTFGSNILLTPFVCKIDYPFNLQINKNEVAEIIEVPFKELFNQDNWDVKKILLAEVKERNIYYFQYKKWVIWGATARIVNQFLSLFKI
ncbi:MAG: CoA pyrophosphatase [Asgard group archaeon]|nr:CoA pyrophosphatase [Asgard group archaeon]